MRKRKGKGEKREREKLRKKERDNKGRITKMIEKITSDKGIDN